MNTNEKGYYIPELGDHRQEEHDIRESYRQEARNREIANQIEKGAQIDPIGTLKKIFAKLF